MPDAFKFYATRLSDTNATSIVSALTGTRIINSVVVANIHTSLTTSIQLQAFSGTNSFTLVPAHTQSTSTSSQLLLSPLPLTTADDLKAKSSVGNAVDVVVSVLERTA
jgi:hypothetical protein